MKKMRRRYDREFKISVVTEIEGGKTPASDRPRARISSPARNLIFRINIYRHCHRGID